MNAVLPASTRRGWSGSAMPKADRAASRRASRCRLRTVRVARPTPLASLTITPASSVRRPKRPEETIPSRAEATGVAVSATQALSRRIVEHGAAHLDQHVRVADGIAGAHPLTMARRPLRQQAEADPVLERGREGDGGHVALVVGSDR